MLAVLRNENLERAEWHLGNLSKVLGEQVWQSAYSLDLLSKTTADEIGARLAAGARPRSDPEFAAHLGDRVGALPDARMFAFVDPKGAAVLHSPGFDATAVNFADREHFRVHLQRRFDGLYVGRPVYGRLAPEWLDVFSRRVEDEQGRLEGVVFLAVSKNYFQKLFAAIDLGESGRVWLFRDDGVLLALNPAEEKDYGRSFAEDPLFLTALPASPSGVLRRAGLTDQVPRIIAYQRLTGFPLVVAVSATEEFVLASWRRDAWRIVGSAGAAVIFLGFTLYFVLRQLGVSDALRHDLLESGDRLQGIVHSAMDAIITIDEEQKIVLFNDAAERIFGCPASEAVGSPVDRFIPERFRSAHRGHVERFGATGETSRRMGERRVLAGVRASGEEFPIDASISHFATEGKIFYTVILRDVTDLRNAETALQQAYHERRAASERLHGIIQSAMDAIITTDREQRIVQFNDAAEKIFRCRELDAIGSPLERFIPERFRAAHRGHIEKFGDTRVTTRIMGDHRLALSGLRADGEEFPIDASISQVTVEGNKYFTVILRDITERKNAEEALRRSYDELRELSGAMHDVREAERTRIARELHDELAQWLTAIKMDVSWLSSRLPREHAQLVDKTDKVKALVDTTVNAVRRIASDLRPVMLDDLGLMPAIESLLHDLSQRTGIVISLDADSGDLDFHEPLATALYRMVQEALTNVARHAGATEVRVTISRGSDDLVLQVLDNGRGFDPEAALRRKSYGIMGIQERAHTLGGRARITRIDAGGTLVEIVIPMARYRKREQGT